MKQQGRTLRRQLLTALAATLAVAVAPGLPAAQAAPAAGQIEFAENPQAVEGRYVVLLADSADRSRDIDSAVDGLIDRYGGDVFHTYRTALRGFAVRMDEDQARRLAADPAVQSVFADGRIHLEGTQRPTPSWGLDRVDQRARPVSNSYTYPTTATNVHAYIIDSGIRISHRDFGGRASYGYDFVDYDPIASDCNGHGTHVAGTVGGSSYGIAKGVWLVAVRAFDCSGNGYFSDAAAAVDWVTENAQRPAVVNMSFGGNGYSPLDSAIEYSSELGITYVAAAGNSDADACYYSPAREETAITVGATDYYDYRAYFSNYGSCVDIFAPGDDITSAWNSSDTASNTISGTSMAAPHVAGAAALYLARNTAATPAQVDARLKAVATNGRLYDVGFGSPNKLLYVQDSDAHHVAIPQAVDYNGGGRDDLAVRRASYYFVDYDRDGRADLSPYLCCDGDVSVGGDFDGNGKADLASRQGAWYYLDTNRDGNFDLNIPYGLSTDVPLTGDFNGDGSDDLGVRRGTTYFLDYNLDGLSNRTVTWGRSDDGHFVGDFNGDGKTDLGLRRGTTYYLDYNLDGVSNRTVTWGRGSDLHLVADFNGDRKADLALRRDNTYYIDYGLDGRTDRTVVFGRDSDVSLTGDFDGDGRDDLVLHRANQFFMDFNLDGATTKTVAFGSSTDSFIGRWA